ncbi:BspA family leucine-rich repeat surface protein [Aequorivita sp. H23M31]|uniref:BspA family leucine-rich repeat surface protein n=1 Tax=Aequorivita ciconiae TaxID=2494375 RepID=A0A410G6W5_9FLAO|nr:BspA family leucine-rich repeat surface protein [Aequorivita sp. H23M31]QAA83006.1 BspA family leucine-rich repeat surface protein [Aequorivita sp. H23M31]
MKKLTFFLCAIFLTMVGFSHGTEPYAGFVTATGDGNGTFSSYQGLAWSTMGQLNWIGTSESRVLAGPGDTCNDPAVITSLPFTVTDNTSNYGDDYGSGDRPPSAPNAVGNPSGSYLQGDDVVYAYTPSANGVINISVTNHDAWTGLFVFTGCPFASTVGGHTNSSAAVPLVVNGLTVSAGVTYYIVISTWPTPQSTPYTLTIEADVFDCPELEANFGDPCDDGNPDTLGDSINENCECEGIVPGPGADCSLAISLDCNGEPVTYDSIGSTATNTTTCSMGNAGLWFTFTGTGNTITINSSAPFDHEMSINSGSCESLTNIACKDGSTGAETYTMATSVAGQAYYVYIAHYASGNTTTEAITISLVCATSFDCPELEANFGDTCDLGGGETGVVNADCECEAVSCQNTTKYPFAAITPNPTGESTTISGCTYWSEYSEITGIIAGYDYQFDSVKAGVSAYVTVREGSVGGPVVAKGYGPLTVTAPSSANLFVHWNANAECGTATGCATSTVSCVSCATELDCEGVPGGPAQPGTPCDDGDPNTLNDVYDEDCNCAGVIPSPGDSCDLAIAISCDDEPATYSTANSVATNVTTCTMGSRGIWFSFEGTGADITVNSSATFDHEMSINTGSCEELVNIVCKDSSTGAESYTVATTVAGQMYYVYIAHYSSSGTTTGDITISLDCAVVPECVAPELTLTAQDANGGAIECLETGGEYYVLASLSGGEGNASYNVAVNDFDFVEVPADGSAVFGPIAAGTTANASAIGVQDQDCVAYATLTSPGICAPANDGCDGAVALVCGETITGSTVGATASGMDSTCNGYTSSSALDVFYTFEADGSSNYTITSDAVQGSFFDGVLYVYSGACGELSNIDCSDSGNPESITLEAPEAGTYTVRLYRYSGTGEFTLGLECSSAPECVAPELTLTAQDANGGAIECLETGGEYYVLASLSGGEGNASYNVAVNDFDFVEVPADGSAVFGPIAAGTTANASAIGVQDQDCVAYATLESPMICPPSNDDCDNAVQLACGQPITGSTVNATASGLPATCNGYTSSSALDVFYSFEADGSSSYTVSLNAVEGSFFDGVLYVYSGSCGELTNIDCSDSGNPETITLEAPEAGTYTVRLYRYSGTGEFTLGLECSSAPECVAPELTLTAKDANGDAIECLEIGGEYYVLATLSGGEGNTSYNVAVNDFDFVEVPAGGSATFGPIDADTMANASAIGVQDGDCVAYATLNAPVTCAPANDDCLDAIMLSCDDSVEGTTYGATYSGLTDGCTSRSTGDVFYTLAVEAGNEYTVTVIGEDYDAVLAIYSGTCGSLTEIACADNGFSAGMAETITWTADATETVVIRTYDWSSSAGSFTISVECTSAPECVAPELTLTAQDANGGPVECLEVGGEYYVLASLSGGEGNTSYNVAVNDFDFVEVPAGGSATFGPIDADTMANASAIGVQDGDCVAYATLNPPVTCAPDNDDCTDAMMLSCGDSVEGTTYGATYSGTTDGCSSRTSGDVFYTLNVEAGNEYTVSVIGEDYDAVLAIYSGTCGSLTEIACADDGFSAGMAETITWTADATETVVIRTYDWSSSAGSFTISVDCTQGGGSCDENAFVTTWRTTSANETITIPTYLGETYNYTVEWGDGSSDSNVGGNITHTYANAGTYTVSICGTFPRIYFNNTATSRMKLRSIEHWGTNVWSSMNGAFAGAENMVSNATDMPDLSMVTDMYGMFAYARSFNGDANFGNWDVGNVTNMAGMFGGASVFNYPIGGWDVGSVTNMAQMFNGATLFNQDLGAWNVANVSNMERMFRTAMRFNQDIGSWNVGSVTDMSYMFFHANRFDQDLGGWDVGQVNDMRRMFKNVTLSRDNYDSLLNGWSSLPTLKQGVTFDGGNSKYCAGEPGRITLTSSPNNWIITDGGKDCSIPFNGDRIDESATIFAISLYPNPMKGQLNLGNPNSAELESVSIFDLTGRLVQKVELNGLATGTVIDVSRLSSATYMVLVKGRQGQATELLIKE